MPSDASRSLARLDRAREVAELYLRGLTQPAIAKRLGVGLATVNRDLKKIHADWQATACEARGAWVGKELARLALVEREAWKAWRKSQQDHEVISVKKTEGGIERTVRREGQAGDSVFLRRVLDVINKRCELLGLNAPTRQEHTGPNGGPIPLAAVQLTDEQLEIIAEAGSPGASLAAEGPGAVITVCPIREPPVPGELAP